MSFVLARVERAVGFEAVAGDEGAIHDHEGPALAVCAAQPLFEGGSLGGQQAGGLAHVAPGGGRSRHTLRPPPWKERCHRRCPGRSLAARHTGTGQALRVLLSSRHQMDHERTRAINALTALVRTTGLDIDARQRLSRAKIRTIAG